MTVQRHGWSMPRQTVGTTRWSCLWCLATCGLYLLATITPASVDLVKVRAALTSLNLDTGPAAQTFFPEYIRFNAQGRRVDAVPVLVQWQDGIPYTVYPTAGATRPAVWPT